MNYCTYRDVMTGNYNCPYATVVNNSVVCTSKECGHNGSMRNQFLGESECERNFKLHSGSVYGNTVYRIALGEDIRFLSDEAFPF